MDLMHEVFGDDMATTYVVAILLGIAVGAVARLSRGFRRRWSASGHEQ
jgi:hypothetical protein